MPTSARTANDTFTMRNFCRICVPRPTEHTLISWYWFSPVVVVVVRPSLSTMTISHHTRRVAVCSAVANQSDATAERSAAGRAYICRVVWCGAGSGFPQLPFSPGFSSPVILMEVGTLAGAGTPGWAVVCYYFPVVGVDVKALQCGFECVSLNRFFDHPVNACLPPVRRRRASWVGVSLASRQGGPPIWPGLSLGGCRRWEYQI